MTWPRIPAETVILKVLQIRHGVDEPWFHHRIQEDQRWRPQRKYSAVAQGDELALVEELQLVDEEGEDRPGIDKKIGEDNQHSSRPVDNHEEVVSDNLVEKVAAEAAEPETEAAEPETEAAEPETEAAERRKEVGEEIGIYPNPIFCTQLGNGNPGEQDKATVVA